MFLTKAIARTHKNKIPAVPEKAVKHDDSPLPFRVSAASPPGRPPPSRYPEDLQDVAIFGRDAVLLDGVAGGGN